MTRLVVFAFAIAFGAWSLGGVDAYYGYGLEAAISKASVDPLAENDTFTSLTPYLLRLLSHPVNFDVDKKKEELLALESTTLLRVKLVGFSEDHRRLSLLQTQLSKYIDTLNPDVHANVIGHEPHRMMSKIRISLEVEKIQGDLGEKIHDALHQEISKVRTKSQVYGFFLVICRVKHLQLYCLKELIVNVVPDSANFLLHISVERDGHARWSHFLFEYFTQIHKKELC